MSPCWKSLDLAVELKQSLRSLCWILQVIINKRTISYEYDYGEDWN
jgi:hypothetical protein